MSTQKRIPVALVGYGYWGVNLLRNLAGTADFDVKAVADLEGSKKDRVERGFPGVQFTTDLDSLLKRTDIEAVVIATPVRTHFELARSALLAGKHVMLEKPATMTTQQADELLDIAAKQSRICLVDHTYLFTPAVQYMKKMIDAGDLGDIQYIDSVRINLGLVQSDVNVLWDLAVHDISIALYLMGERPLSVRASAGVKTHGGMENVGYMSMNYANDKIVHVSCSWASPVKIRHMLVGGKKKMVLFNDLEPSEKIKIYDTGYEVRTEEDKRRIKVDYRVGDIFIPNLSKKEALAAICEEFASCIRQPRESRSDLKRAKDTVSVLASAQKSLESRGEEVRIEWGK